MINAASSDCVASISLLHRPCFSLKWSWWVCVCKAVIKPTRTLGTWSLILRESLGEETSGLPAFESRVLGIWSEMAGETFTALRVALGLDTKLTPQRIGGTGRRRTHEGSYVERRRTQFIRKEDFMQCRGAEVQGTKVRHRPRPWQWRSEGLRT